MAAPYSLNLDPSVAQQLADQGGTLLVLDLPEGSYFGIDHMVGSRRCLPSRRPQPLAQPHHTCSALIITT